MNHRAEHHFLPFDGGRAGAQFAADIDLRDVADADRHAVAVAETMLPISAIDRTWPGARTRYCSPRFSM
jgi:hypothetical protein